MTFDPVDPGELLQQYGPVVSRVLQRQFPSLGTDVIDDLVLEAIARIWKKISNASDRSAAPQSLFPLILTAAKRRAIDRLRYSPRLVLMSPEILEQISEDKDFLEQILEDQDSDVSSTFGVLLREMHSAIAMLEPLDRRILETSLDPNASGRWARELASELLKEQLPKSSTSKDDARQIAKLAGRLRVRKLRVVSKLRQTMRARGYDIPEAEN
jgi:RNA polymerase sigma factor (sigma-70 family)